MRVSSVLALLAMGWPLPAWASSSDCLCTYGQSCWPSASTFAKLQSQVSQPLIHPLPSASGCYPAANPSGNCTAIHENWTNGNWRSFMPGAMEAPNFEAFIFPNGTVDACYLNTTITGVCGQGRVPVIGVDARSVEDIRAAVTFAVQQNLKLVVKNTGHDLIGRSTARGSFVVWTHNMKNITYHSTFVPQGAPVNETVHEVVTVEAGVQWHEVYDTVHNYGRLMVGGVSAGGSIGAAGGWLAGGGHSALSPSYGLGVDNAIEMSVVLSTGKFLTVNKYQNSDLFWSLRGGGGATYGIVTSVTYRTHPSVPCQLYIYQANVTNSSVFPELVGGLMRHQTQFTNNGWGGYGTLSGTQLAFSFVGPNMTNETAMATTQPWHDFSASLESFGVVSAKQIVQYPSWYKLYQTVFSGGVENGVKAKLTSRLFSRESVATKSDEIAKILIECGGGFIMVAGGKVSQVSADSAGLNPAWRNAITEGYCEITWDDSTPSKDIKGLISKLKGWIKALHEATPNDGAYLNEVSPFELNWQKTLFGSHYSTLKAIKDKYDPNRLFAVELGVGSDEWNKELTCRH